MSNKVMRGGLLSTYIDKMAIGDTIDASGPFLKMEYIANSFKEVGMVAGGSGITPMLQVADEILENPLDTTNISMVFANVSENDVMLKDELDKRVAQYPDRIKIHYVVDRVEKNSTWTGGIGHITLETLREKMPAPDPTVQIYVCGPPPFMEALSGGRGEEMAGFVKDLGYPNVHKF
jgi:cytochrome-b5 reductase